MIYNVKLLSKTELIEVTPEQLADWQRKGLKLSLVIKTEITDATSIVGMTRNFQTVERGFFERADNPYHADPMTGYGSGPVGEPK
jgi:hypothetical protein